MFNELFTHGPKFTYNADNNAFIGIRDFLVDHSKDQKYQVKGMFVTKTGKYGPSGVVILDGFNLNVPKHMIEKIETIRNNPELVQAINEGKCGIVFRDYEDSNNITRTTVDFVDF